MNLKYHEILDRNIELGKALPKEKYIIRVLSNIIVSQQKEILEYSLRSEGIPAVVETGDYDNIVQDSLKFKDANLIIIFWELCNLVEGLYYKIDLFDESRINEIFDKMKLEIDFVFKGLEHTSLVLINKFTAINFSSFMVNKNNLQRLADKLNKYLEDNVPKNVKLVDLEGIISIIGVRSALDFRYYLSSKALYTIEFFKVYSEYIKPFVMSANGRAKKVLIFDCDNTLWKGVLGEDGFNGIDIDPSSKEGAVFSEVQHIALFLSRQGVLIGLCSKNNPDDVDEVIRSHPDMIIRDENLSVRKIDWSDKVTNLKRISEELNLGLDSFVFVDDSSFEVNLVREQLPEVKVLQVPKNLSCYPKLMRESLGLFYNLSFTNEDMKRLDMSKDQAKRESSKEAFGCMDDYLASLGMKMTILQDDESIIPRMAQLSQKTNQFNLTTKRYSEGNIKKFVEDADTQVFTFSLSDKFGDSGITGLCILKIDRDTMTAGIDTFLMSCRIIGRNVEYAFMDFLIQQMNAQGIKKCNAKYVKTKKNDQVECFFDKCSFSLVSSSSTEKEYYLDPKDYKLGQTYYLEVIYGGKN